MVFDEFPVCAIILMLLLYVSAPYVKLDMNPVLPGVDEKAVYKDAMFFSVHKFIGGVQTPGLFKISPEIQKSAC